MLAYPFHSILRWRSPKGVILRGVALKDPVIILIMPQPWLPECIERPVNLVGSFPYLKATSSLDSSRLAPFRMTERFTNHHRPITVYAGSKVTDEKFTDNRQLPWILSLPLSPIPYRKAPGLKAAPGSRAKFCSRMTVSIQTTNHQQPYTSHWFFHCASSLLLIIYLLLINISGNFFFSENEMLIILSTKLCFQFINSI